MTVTGRMAVTPLVRRVLIVAVACGGAGGWEPAGKETPFSFSF
jgi:hypothetical protein